MLRKKPIVKHYKIIQAVHKTKKKPNSVGFFNENIKVVLNKAMRLLNK